MKLKLEFRYDAMGRALVSCFIPYTVRFAIMCVGGLNFTGMSACMHLPCDRLFVSGTTLHATMVPCTCMCCFVPHAAYSAHAIVALVCTRVMRLMEHTCCVRLHAGAGMLLRS